MVTADTAVSLWFLSQQFICSQHKAMLLRWKYMVVTAGSASNFSLSNSCSASTNGRRQACKESALTAHTASNSNLSNSCAAGTKQVAQGRTTVGCMLSLRHAGHEMLLLMKSLNQSGFPCWAHLALGCTFSRPTLCFLPYPFTPIASCVSCVHAFDVSMHVPRQLRLPGPASLLPCVWRHGAY